MIAVGGSVRCLTTSTPASIGRRSIWVSPQLRPLTFSGGGGGGRRSARGHDDELQEPRGGVRAGPQRGGSPAVVGGAVGATAAAVRRGAGPGEAAAGACGGVPRGAVPGRAGSGGAAGSSGGAAAAAAATQACCCCCCWCCGEGQPPWTPQVLRGARWGCFCVLVLVLV